MRGVAIVAVALLALADAGSAMGQENSADWQTCKSDDHDKAIAACSREIRNPQRHKSELLAFLYGARGKAYAAKADHVRAITDYTQALKLDPSNIAALINRGISHRSQKNCNIAISDYTKAIELEPSNYIAYSSRGRCYSDMDDEERAIFDFSQALNLNPSTASTFYGRGRSHAKNGNLDQAIADYSQAIKLRPDYRDAYISRAMTYKDRGEPEKAMTDYDRAIAIDPNYSLIYLNRGVLYVETGATKAGEADFRKVLSLPNKDGTDQMAVDLALRMLERQSKQPAPPPAVPTLPATKPSPAVASPAPAPTPTPKPNTPATRRVALVVGIGAYAHLSKLDNPTRDAAAVAKLLRSQGFATVLEKPNLAFADFDDVLADLNRAATGADEVLVYFAGHGVRIAGRDMLAPTDFQYVCPEEAPGQKLASSAERVASVSRGIDVETQLLPRLPVAAKKIVVIDACRNAPFLRCKTRGDASGGLAFNYRAGVPYSGSDVVDPVIFASTRPGALASDGVAGRNSPFAIAFVEKLGSHPQRMWQRLMNEIAVDVSKATQNAQTPVLVSGNAPASCVAGSNCRWD